MECKLPVNSDNSHISTFPVTSLNQGQALLERVSVAWQ